MAKETVYLVDGSGYIYRAYYAIRRLSTRDGLATNAVYGFANMLLKVLKERKPTYIAIAFDVGGETFRHEMYPAYKANRSAPPEDLPAQIPLIHEVVDAFKIPRLSMGGVEADDVLATAAKRFVDLGHPVRIITGDKDFMQLVDDDLILIDEMRAQRGDSPTVDRDAVIEKFGVPPESVIDILALAGDSSDNVPGVKGIGAKTAAQLIKDHGDLEAILKAAPGIKQKARRERLIEHADLARLSKKLVTIRTDLDLTLTLDQLSYTGPDGQTLRALFEQLEFERLLDDPIVKAGAASASPPPQKGALKTEAKKGDAQGDLFAPKTRPSPKLSLVPDDYTVLESIGAVKSHIGTAGPLYVHVVHDRGEAGEPDEVVGIALCTEDGTAGYVPCGHDARVTETHVPADEVIALLAAHDGPLRTDGAKDALRAMLDAGHPALDFSTDIEILSYLLDPQRDRHDAFQIAGRRLHIDLSTEQEVRGKGKSARPFAMADLQHTMRFASDRCVVTRKVHGDMRKALDDAEMGTLYDTLELPLSRVLAEVEENGVYVDEQALGRIGDEFTQDIADLEERAHDAAGERFLVSSPQQVAEILFDKLGLKVLKRTAKGGAASTDSSVLEQLKDQHALPEIILEYRQLTKLKNTYIDVLPGLIRSDTGRVHTRFHQTVAATGRLSSSDPNLQNIPARSDLGRRIRQAFCAEKGNALISCDYSQIELRILAHVTQDAVMLDTFQKGMDVHRRTAAEIFDRPFDEVTPDERTAAKAINFGLLYGMGVQRLAREIGKKRSEAKVFLDKYFERYPGFRSWHDERLIEAKKDGSVRTLFGRRRLLPELKSKSRAEAARGERLAINTPIQGSAADIMKRAMIDAHAALKTHCPDAKILLQVHDELLVEAPSAVAADAQKVVQDAMESAFALDVPLVVDGAFGPSWADIH